MAQITSREELEEWLKDKPADWASVISMRAALRVLPFACGNRAIERRVSEFTLTLIRPMLISWAGWNLANYDVGAAARSAAIAAYKAARAPAALAVYTNSANAAGDAAFYFVHPSGPKKAADTVLYTANAARGWFTKSYADAADAYAAVWQNVAADLSWLINRGKSPSAPGRLTHEKIQFVSTRNASMLEWPSAIDRLLTLDPTYQVWIDWYNRRIEGHDAAFDIPGDTDRTEDKAILIRLADATDKEFWDKGATYVNTTLQGWIDEARERAAAQTPDDSPPSTPETIRAVAAEIASPTITLTNNQLDVIANTAFDGQTDTANLDEAIAILRAVVAALLGGLPGNAPRSFAANLTIYDGELAKRDAKPFLGVLVRMEKSVSAGFHADPEMFDAGVTTNFESYFDAHLAFMTHYRRNEEREAKIAQFTIDDAAASGVALTGPVDEVVKEVDALAEQGLVTDGFVQAIKEQQAINYEVALYTSPASAKSGEPTVKERHILQTVGFYERTLAIAANTIAVTTQFAAFIIVLKTAIEALLKFFN